MCANGGYTYAANWRWIAYFRTVTGVRPMKLARRATSRGSARRAPPKRTNLHRDALSLRLEAAREEERGRLARELHDELGQVLTSLKLEFTWLIEQLRSGEPKPSLQLVNKLQALTGLIEVSIQSVRHISGDLRPAVLDHLGLAEAVQWEATKFEARTGIRCRVRSSFKPERLDRTRALALFRIIQEALTNVARHAHAGAVRITLQGQARWLTLVVRDNGRGITKREATNFESIGLLGMAERARLIGGRVTVGGTPGRGTTVSVQVPYK